MPDDSIAAWVIDDRPGVTLYIGVRKGHTRPQMWMTSIADADGEPAILASFHGPQHARAAISFLDTLTGAVQRAIDFHTGDGKV